MDSYRDVFAWDLEVVGASSDFRYTMASANGENCAGILDATTDLATSGPHWVVYFQVGSVDEALERVATLR